MAAGAAAAAAAIIRAIRASGVIVRVTPEEFSRIVGRAAKPLVVTAKGGLFSARYQYLMSYKGLAFFTGSTDALALPADTELVQADKIWIPG
jgi:hypothetical protein